MKSPNNTDRVQGRLESAYKKLVGAICALVVFQGALVLWGWVFGNIELLRLLPGFNYMRFNAALCLIVSGIGLWLTATKSATAALRFRLARALGFFVFAVALLTLAETVFGWNLHIDQLLWKDAWSPLNPGRMAPLTAAIYALVGTFLILQGAARPVLCWTAQVAAIAANMIAQYGILDLLFGANKQDDMAIHTALSLFVLSIGMLLSPNQKGFLEPLLSESAGGRILRSLLVPAIVVPVIGGWLFIGAARASLIDSTAGTCTLVVLSSGILLILIIWTANSIDAIDLRMSAIINSSDDAIISKSFDGTILSWNPGAERLFGYAKSEMIGRSFFLLVPPERHQELQHMLDSVRQGEFVKHHETERVRKDGSQVDVSVTLSPVRDARRRVIAISAISRDNTERKKSEAALNRSEEAYRTLAELVPQLVWKSSPDGLNIYFNQRWADYTGMTLEESRGTGWNTPFHPDDKQPAWDAWNNAVQTGGTYLINCRLRAADGTYRWFLIKGLPSRDAAGNISLWFGTCTDIDDLKRAEESIQTLNRDLEEKVELRTIQLRESERQVRKKLESILSPEVDLANLELVDILDVPVVQSLVDDLFHLTRIPCWILDLKGNILISAGGQDACMKFHRENHETCRNCSESDLELSAGVPAGKFKVYKCKNNMWDVVTPIMLAGRHIGNLFSGQFFFENEAIDADLFRAQAVKYGFDEQQYMAAINRVPRLSHDEIQSGMAFYNKLAEVLSNLGHSGIKLAHAMAGTSRANAQLVISSQELESFAYSVSHDLRAPLRHLDGFLTLLRKRSYSTLDDQSKHYVDCTLEASRRMGRLIDDLLQFSRLGRSEIHKIPVDLNTIVDEVRKELEPETRDRVIIWQVDRLPDVAADKGMLRQVIQNLLGNALKFTRHCPTARIEVGFKAEPNGNLVFSVRDNGAGFDMRYCHKLFQVFQRLHGEHEFEGTGIGLAISRRVVERHGGRIWAEGIVGAGATFYFSLPAESSDEGELNDLAEAHLVG